MFPSQKPKSNKSQLLLPIQSYFPLSLVLCNISRVSYIKLCLNTTVHGRMSCLWFIFYFEGCSYHSVFTFRKGDGFSLISRRIYPFKHWKDLNKSYERYPKMSSSRNKQSHLPFKVLNTAVANKYLFKGIYGQAHLTCLYLWLNGNLVWTEATYFLCFVPHCQECLGGPMNVAACWCSVVSALLACFIFWGKDQTILLTKTLKARDNSNGTRWTSASFFLLRHKENHVCFVLHTISAYFIISNISETIA